MWLHLVFCNTNAVDSPATDTTDTNIKGSSSIWKPKVRQNEKSPAWPSGVCNHKGGDKAAHSVRRAVAQHAPCLRYYLSGLHLLYVCLSTLTFRATSVGGGERERRRRRNHRTVRRPNSHRWSWKSLLIVTNMRRNGVLTPHLYCVRCSDHWEELAILLFSDEAWCCQCSPKACGRCCCCFLIKTFTNEMPNVYSNLQFFTIKKDWLLIFSSQQLLNKMSTDNRALLLKLKRIIFFFFYLKKILLYIIQPHFSS